mgnify:FL=1|jgi:transcription initiation factor TFIIIB Brf1 subunit/transcription initiation factor TFIIB|tara:strand:+ start:235 stop:1080 length:846 start_codon:yes stop_codon:yes gene_type:complete
MRCEDCKTYVIKYDIEYGCPNCGLVHSPILENKLPDRHRDNNKLGSIIGSGRGSYKLRRLAVTSKLSNDDRSMKKVTFYQNIVVSEFSMSETCKITINEYYYKLKRKHVFTSKMSLEERVAAIGYIVLKEYNYSYTLKEVSKRLEILPKRVSKLSRLFARTLSKSYVFSNNNVSSLVEKFCLELSKDRKFIGDCISLYTYLDKIESRYPTSAYLAGIIYCVETTQPSKSTTQKEIGDVFNIKLLAVRNNYKKILSNLKIKSTFGLTIDDIIEGIRWQDQEV